MRFNLIWDGDLVSYAGATWEVIDTIPGAFPDGAALYVFRLSYMFGRRNKDYAHRTIVHACTRAVTYVHPMEALALASIDDPQ